MFDAINLFLPALAPDNGRCKDMQRSLLRLQGWFPSNYTENVLDSSEDDAERGASMSNLAKAYSDLGRHEDALVMGESALEFARRVFPPDHPDIGFSMSNLANA